MHVFKLILEGLEPNFHRNLFSETQFKYYGLSSSRLYHNKLKKKNKNPLDKIRDEEEPLFLPFIRDLEMPFLAKAGEKSKKVYFILQGNVHVMNSNGMYDYAMV